MNSEEYNKGKEMGELVAEMRTHNNLLSDFVQEQRDINEKYDNRLRILEQWVQQTTGKVIILTTIFGIVGSVCYIAVNWLIAHWNIK